MSPARYGSWNVCHPVGRLPSSLSRSDGECAEDAVTTALRLRWLDPVAAHCFLSVPMSTGTHLPTSCISDVMPARMSSRSRVWTAHTATHWRRLRKEERHPCFIAVLVQLWDSLVERRCGAWSSDVVLTRSVFIACRCGRPWLLSLDVLRSHGGGFCKLAALSLRCFKAITQVVSTAQKV